MKVEELLKGYAPQKFFILDSHQTAMNEQDIGHRYDDSDYIGYGYNIHQFNQLVPGSFFLYRRPGKLSPDKKFHIYGGGIVDIISKPDADGNVIAKIKLGFELENPINQGEPFIEQFNWKTREKPGPGWKGFWLNYGMNEIKPEDYWNLIKGRICVLSGNQISSIQTVEENEAVNYTFLDSGFRINVNNTVQSVHRNRINKTVYLEKKIDFNQLNLKKKTIGTAGELLVLEYENEKLEKAGSKKRAEHVAETIGDGLGYDIKSYDENDREIHIEVKTTKTNQCDGFFMSKKEIEESQNKDYKYMVYRLYNYNPELKTVTLAVFEGAVTETNYDLVPTCYRIRLK